MLGLGDSLSLDRSATVRTGLETAQGIFQNGEHQPSGRFRGRMLRADASENCSGVSK
jgi:hypothetical protein